jgi:hypothetical protein
MISPSSSAVFRPLEEGGVILNVENGDYFQVNATGRFIWEALAEGIERHDLVAKMASSFDIGEEEAAEDVDQFLGELGDRSLIEDSG